MMMRTKGSEENEGDVRAKDNDKIENTKHNFSVGGSHYLKMGAQSRCAINATSLEPLQPVGNGNVRYLKNS